MDKIRNFCIIAHIDHGKSTISDRMLEITNTVEDRKMKAQLLDRMDIEQERGITIKLQPVTMEYKGYTLNLIDTPGHVDFTYEVSRSLAACEAAILLVDATQGIQAQTLANLYLAMDQNLTIIPVANKIDLPASNKEKTKREIMELLGCNEDEIYYASGKTGEGVPEILDAIIKKVPEPKGNPDAPLRSLIFDSNYDEYKGVVAYIRVIDGELNKKDKIRLLATMAESEALDVGIFKPDYLSTGKLKTGEIGYVVTGFKNVTECGVGDTLTINKKGLEIKSLKGYSEVKPMVYAGIFPKEGNEFENLRDAIDKLKLNDSALVYEAEHSDALGFGFRCGFLGILHLEIFQERLKREFNIELIVTVPSVSYRVYQKNGKKLIVRTPQQFPKRELIEYSEEPWVSLDIITPSNFVGAIMGLAQDKRGIYKNIEYIDETRAIIHYEIPMSAILTDFYDKIKSATQGYASINYEFLSYKKADVVKMDILVAEEPVESLSVITYADDIQKRGKEIVNILKDSLPRQMFVIKLQASVGGKIVAGDRLSAMRKDVTAKLYGGDVSRKRKLLQKQKAGKKKMMASGKGSVDIPSDTFIKLLKK
ncbi:translation elongation factor 4 [Candidatus Parcubacteria bacterium]|nr:translation elongation factor 4 [Candidatus Parcubacteria bacterium]